MADEATLQADLDAIKSLVTTKIDALNATIATLKDQIAAGSPVSQAQLDSLDAEAKDIVAKLSA